MESDIRPVRRQRCSSCSREDGWADAREQGVFADGGTAQVCARQPIARVMISLAKIFYGRAAAVEQGRPDFAVAAERLIPVYPEAARVRVFRHDFSEVQQGQPAGVGADVNVADIDRLWWMRAARRALGR